MYLVILVLHFKNELNFCIEYCTHFSNEEYIVCNISLNTREHYCFEILCVSTQNLSVSFCLETVTLAALWVVEFVRSNLWNLMLNILETWI